MEEIHIAPHKELTKTQQKAYFVAVIKMTLQSIVGAAEINWIIVEFPGQQKRVLVKL